MSKRSQEKRKARAKEKAKVARRLRGASPLSRLAGDGSDVECWMMYMEGETRLVNMLAFRAVRQGGHAAALFLIDYDCVGVKDAFCKFDVLPSEVIASYRERSKVDGSRLVKVEGERMRSILGSAARWGREHGFRVSGDWEKCLRIVGGTVDVEGAALTGFGTEGGGLKYVGRRRDLERLLANESVEDFEQRDDVECVFMDAVWEEFDEGEGFLEEEGEEEDLPDEEEVEEIMGDLTKMILAIVGEIRSWLEEQGEKPHERLEAAMQMRMMSAMASLARGELDLTVKDAMEAALDGMEEGVERDELRAAHQQIVRHVEAFGRGLGSDSAGVRALPGAGGVDGESGDEE